MKDYLKETIRFVMKTELLAGEGVSQNLPSILKSRNWVKTGVVVDKGLYENNDYAKEIVELLENKLDQVVFLVNEMAEPTYDYLDKVKTKFDGADLNCYIGIGGGSTLDLTKGLSTMKTNEGKAPMDRAVVALSYLAESPNSKSANLAVQILNHGSSNISSAVAPHFRFIPYSTQGLANEFPS